MVGKLIPDFFPKIFGPQQDQPLDADAVRAAFAELAREIGDGRTAEEVADGFIKIAVENMANAIKKISVQRGYDVTRYALNCFGGAGGQHACLVADALGMTTVLIHPFSSLLSAYGMGLADIRATRQQAIEMPLGGARAAGDLRGRRRSSTSEAGRGTRCSRACRSDSIRIEVRAHLRYAGTDTAIPSSPTASCDASATRDRRRIAAGRDSRITMVIEHTRATRRTAADENRAVRPARACARRMQERFEMRTRRASASSTRARRS